MLVVLVIVPVAHGQLLLSTNDNKVTLVNGVATAVTPKAYYEALVNKAFQRLVQDDIRVSLETGLKAARKWGYRVKGIPEGKAEIIACENNFHGRSITIVGFSSDPQYGDRSRMEIEDGSGRKIEGVYRIDTDGRVTRIITHEVDRPNGLVVTPDDKYLYVADNNNNSVGGARKLWRFDLKPNGTVVVEVEDQPAPEEPPAAISG